MDWVQMIFSCLRALSRSRTDLAAGNLALRQQLAVLSEQKKRPKFRKRYRVFWVWLSHFWTGRRSILVSVQPETVVRCHLSAF